MSYEGEKSGTSTKERKHSAEASGEKKLLWTAKEEKQEQKPQSNLWNRGGVKQAGGIS